MENGVVSMGQAVDGNDRFLTDIINGAGNINVGSLIVVLEGDATPPYIFSIGRDVNAVWSLNEVEWRPVQLFVECCGYGRCFR